MASPGIKGGHFSDASNSVSSKHRRRPAGAYKLLIVLGAFYFLTTIRVGIRFTSRNYLIGGFHISDRFY